VAQLRCCTVPANGGAVYGAVTGVLGGGGGETPPSPFAPFVSMLLARRGGLIVPIFFLKKRVRGYECTRKSSSMNDAREKVTKSGEMAMKWVRTFQLCWRL
jgi:hypothetical protein